jgi:hypothetical protein
VALTIKKNINQKYSTNKTCALLKLKGAPEFALMVHKNNSCLKNFEALRKEKLAQTSMKKTNRDKIS